MKITQMAPFVMKACRLENEKSGKIFARELRNAKLLNSGGHGVNAPDMTNVDLAAFLIALLGTDKPAKAVEICEYLGSFQLTEFMDWGVGSSKLPSDPNHTFKELMEAFCDPEVQLPYGISIEVTGTAQITVTNDDIFEEDTQDSMTFVYCSRSDMTESLKKWDGVRPDDWESDSVKEAIQYMLKSPLSLHGLVTSRRISAHTIGLIKTFMFPEHYGEEIRAALADQEAK